MKVLNQNPSRRDFLSTGAAALALPTIISASALGVGSRPAPSDTLSIGIVGVGSRGFNLIDDILRRDDARIVAICDVDAIHYRDRTWGEGTSYGREPAKAKIDQHYESGQGVATTPDFTELTRREDIDAIVVATPDHWHALCALDAIQNGKDVYCEKPVTHKFREGVAVYQAVAEYGTVFQTGSQQRSESVFHQAVRLIRSGVLGTVSEVQVGLPPGYENPMGDATVTEPPESLDYDAWCGPAHRLPYMRARHHRWWRGHRAFGGGVLMDWIGHHNDIAHWALGVELSGPSKVTSIGWTEPATDIYNSPHHYEIECEYANGARSSISSRHPVGSRFVSDEGWIFVSRGKIEASNPDWLNDDRESSLEEMEFSQDHIGDFLSCIKSREQCAAPAEVAHRSITPGHLGYVSFELGRALRWDPDREEVIDDAAANERLNHVSYRGPWSIEL